MSKPISAIPSAVEFRYRRDMPGRYRREMPSYASMEQTVELDPFFADQQLVGRLQFGCTIRNPGRRPMQDAEVAERMARLLHDHVYGGVVDELAKVKRDLYSEGFTDKDPAYKRICDLIDTLREGGVK